MVMFTVLGAKGAAIATAVVTPITNLLGDFIQVFKYSYVFFMCLYYWVGECQTVCTN